MKIRPLYDRIVVKRIEQKETMQGGLYIPDSAKEKPQEGEVVAVGKGKRLEDGKLTSETFEGDLERGVYDRAVNDAQRYFLDQTALMLKSLSFLLPYSWKQRTDRD